MLNNERFNSILVVVAVRGTLKGFEMVVVLNVKHSTRQCRM